MNTHTLFTRVYYPSGRVAHLCPDDRGLQPLCDTAADLPAMLGTGSQDEIDRAATMPLCTRCVAIQQNQLRGRREIELVRSSGIPMQRINTCCEAVLRTMRHLREIDPTVRYHGDVPLTLLVAVTLAEAKKRTRRD